MARTPVPIESIHCPHCRSGTAVSFNRPIKDAEGMRDEATTRYTVGCGYCESPECHRLIIWLEEHAGESEPARQYVVPRSKARMGLRDVPADMATDYEQACAVQDLSPPASAALARRCLQRVIREHFGVKRDSLHDEINEVAQSGRVPPYLVDLLDKVRKIGNLAAHPAQDRETGLIVDVEKDEALWTLEIIEGLFRYCYVEARETERRTKSLNDKLGRAGGSKSPA